MMQKRTSLMAVVFALVVLLVGTSSLFAQEPCANVQLEEEAQYAYTANIMNDVHMSHAMEFPCPQSMSTCATCHEGKLDLILTDANFKLETCKSCHPVTGPEDGTQANRAPALETVMHHGISLGKCSNCHSAGGIAPAFNEVHTGYNKMIYAAADLKYSDAIVVTIDDASVVDNKLTIKFSAAEVTDLGGIEVADILPTVMVGMYGWDRNIGEVPLYITGPGSRACGSCHRSMLINEDEAGELISLNQHTKQGGYLIEGGDDYTVTLDEVIDYIMALFK